VPKATGFRGSRFPLERVELCQKGFASSLPSWHLTFSIYICIYIYIFLSEIDTNDVRARFLCKRKKNTKTETVLFLLFLCTLLCYSFISTRLSLSKKKTKERKFKDLFQDQVKVNSFWRATNQLTGTTIIKNSRNNTRTIAINKMASF